MNPPAEALRALCGAGARLVLMWDKAPFEPAWAGRRPSAERVVEHMWEGGTVGVQPGSLGCTVLDIDEGWTSHAAWRLFCGDDEAPLVVLPTRRGAHAYWPVRTRARGRWSARGCAGDIITGGAACLYGDGAIEALAAALDAGPAADTRLPRAVFPDGRVLNPGAPARREPAAGEVQLGERNEALFLRLRKWAHRQVHDAPDAAAWSRMVEAEASSIANEFGCAPEARSKVRATARSVERAVWTRRRGAAARPGGVDPAVQRERGRLSGMMRALYAADDDAEIARLLRAGLSQRKVAKRLGMSKSKVQGRAALMR